MTRNGIATNVSASTTASGEKGMVSPNHSSRYRPTKPVRPSASSSATPPTTGGSTSGSGTSARSSRPPGNRAPASTHASGTPMTTQTPVDTRAAEGTARGAKLPPRKPPPPSAATASGLLELVGGEHRLPGVGQDVGHERLRQRGVPAVGERGDRVLGGGVHRVGDRDALHLR